MESESLRDKRQDECGSWCYLDEDVREAVKKLKEINFGCGCCTSKSPYDEIDKIFGSKLT